MGKITPLFGGKAGEPAQNSSERELAALIEEATTELAVIQKRICEYEEQERRWAKKAEHAARSAREWEQRAMAAVRAGDDVVASDALSRKRREQAECERLFGAVTEQRARTAALARVAAATKARLDEAKRGRAALDITAETPAGSMSRESTPPTARRDNAARTAADDALHERMAATMTHVATELELSDAAMANLARDAAAAERDPGKPALAKREILPPAPSPSKPLAKTAPVETAVRSDAGAAGVSGPRRTKR